MLLFGIYTTAEITLVDTVYKALSIEYQQGSVIACYLETKNCRDNLNFREISVERMCSMFFYKCVCCLVCRTQGRKSGQEKIPRKNGVCVFRFFLILFLLNVSLGDFVLDDGRHPRLHVLQYVTDCKNIVLRR